MKYKNRTHAKRKHKQMLLATVATMTLGISTLGGTASVFADEKASEAQQEQFTSASRGGEGYGWKTKDGVRYFYNKDQQMHEGWLVESGKSFYLSHGRKGLDDISSDGKPVKKGQMMTGWFNDEKGRSHYLSPEYGMKNSEGEVFEKGQMMTGWVEVDGRWHYLSPESGKKNSADETFNKGQMMTGKVEINGKQYYLSPEPGKKNSAGEMFNKGQMMTGWVEVNKQKWSYCSPTNNNSNMAGHKFNKGQMMTGWIEVDGKEYYIVHSASGFHKNHSGKIFYTGEMMTGETYIHEGNDESGPLYIYAFDSNGIFVTKYKSK
ncbi:hypothetical protein BK720_08000 [Bacillus thuringiensis serovar brasilensis]|uniref:hypothetical protein n=1 Tax=Bacillus cereus group TaxID=86661 RepID=UPI000A3C567B|nr:hypothetical protein [Bacillus thuringiensis]MCU5031439.1 hypothetical protein [Bacillus cereus]MRA74170.1 hypothetical protein [Bacillus thuringiensis]MRA92720.1 hypothetical protein [Bacillus thuringiensis]MRC55334.1 hypothetical protein [Bacillus thuringiensis]OTX35221.1 hypothetical protein BK720_08000 [Bacillus thuringiensis serovar brasilensis]